MLACADNSWCMLVPQNDSLHIDACTQAVAQAAKYRGLMQEARPSAPAFVQPEPAPSKAQDVTFSFKVCALLRVLSLVG
jgi:hypothetical protein